MPMKPKRPCRYTGRPGSREQGQVFCKEYGMETRQAARGRRCAGGVGPQAARGTGESPAHAPAVCPMYEIWKDHPGEVGGLHRTAQR